MSRYSEALNLTHRDIEMRPYLFFPNSTYFGRRESSSPDTRLWSEFVRFGYEQQDSQSHYLTYMANLVVGRICDVTTGHKCIDVLAFGRYRYPYYASIRTIPGNREAEEIWIPVHSWLIAPRWFEVSLHGLSCLLSRHFQRAVSSYAGNEAATRRILDAR